MISDKLLQARIYEKNNESSAESRPRFHFTPRTGWMNDPNGFSYYDGAYHLFYQYYPYETKWGPMHWGHARSEDLVHWEYLPAALAPDRSYDAEGCWSGSAVTLPDGRQLLVYTGRQVTENREEGIFQVQCLAVGDGLDYEKYEGNPVITGADLPDGASVRDFRDPKVWLDETTGCYLMAVGSRAADGSGQILLFRSRDGFSWAYVKVLEACHGQYGHMWECPDFTVFGDKGLLMVSPQDMIREGEFQNAHGNMYLAGSYDKETCTFSREEVHAIDHGYDFYATQTIIAPDGRRIMIAWMQAWENAHEHPFPQDWAGMMTVPRELTLKGNRLIQNPIREIEKLRSDKVFYHNLTLNGRIKLAGISGRCLDMTVDVKPVSPEDHYEYFEIRLAEGEVRGRYYTSVLRYEPAAGLITFDRSVSGYAGDCLPARKLKLDENRNGAIRFRILLDKYSAEIFVNDGEYVLSSVLETSQAAKGISFISQGDCRIDIEKYDML